MNANRILQIENLSKTFDRVRVLDRVTLEVQDSERIVAITGPNAAGKTTLFNVVTGMVRPDPEPVAVVNVLGSPVLCLEPWEIARLGVARLFQDARVFLNLTVLENIHVAGDGRTSGSWWSAIRRPRADASSIELLDFVGLAGRRHERAAVLSLGERRKLAIACMLRTGARLLLLDEPTANLDRASTVQMRDLILSLAQQDKHLVIIEHNHEFVQEVAQTSFTLHQGKCIRDTTVTSSPSPSPTGGAS